MWPSIPLYLKTCSYTKIDKFATFCLEIVKKNEKFENFHDDEARRKMTIYDNKREISKNGYNIQF